jgi:RNA polymerase sigma-70 factor (ECF subfamily)
MASDVTQLLDRVSQGDKKAKDDLLRHVYDELRKRAASYMVRQRPDHTLQPTALVHEAYIKLLGNDRLVFQNRHHFYRAAAQAMRQILVDHARAKKTAKRRGSILRVEMEGLEIASREEGEEMDYEMLDLAMQALESMDKRRHEVAMLKFYGGLEVKEIAAMLGVTPKTVQRDWETAKLVLKGELLKSRCE